MGIGSFVGEWKSLSRFNSLSPEDRSIVFYAEDGGSWRYFEPIISELVGPQNKSVCYVTSSPRDPVLQTRDGGITTFCIGSGSVRTKFFMFLQAGVLVMTMPDLEKFHIKRSKFPVHYVYVFHSIVSTHMAYRRGAFDNYDSILCVGPHHQQEIRQTERHYGLKPKTLVEAGYGILDAIVCSQDAQEAYHPQSKGQKRVLVAPSWGDHALIETQGAELVDILLAAGFQVTLRPHGMTIRNRSKLLAELQRRFESNPNFQLAVDLKFQGTVSASDIMISDWSGAALEYSLGLDRPVLFIDLPKKINNQDYETIPSVPIEVQLRSEVGAVVAPDQLQDVPDMINALCEDPRGWKERIAELRSRWIYNVGGSGAVAADYIAEAALAAEATTVKS